MGSPLGSSLDNTFLAYHEQNYSPLEYRRSTFSGVYTHFNIFLPDTYKIGMIYTLINNVFGYALTRQCSIYNWYF